MNWIYRDTLASENRFMNILCQDIRTSHCRPWELSTSSTVCWASTPSAGSPQLCRRSASHWMYSTGESAGTLMRMWATSSIKMTRTVRTRGTSHCRPSWTWPRTMFSVSRSMSALQRPSLNTSHHGPCQWWKWKVRQPLLSTSPVPFHRWRWRVCKLLLSTWLLQVRLHRRSERDRGAPTSTSRQMSQSRWGLDTPCKAHTDIADHDEVGCQWEDTARSTTFHWGSEVGGVRLPPGEPRPGAGGAPQAAAPRPSQTEHQQEPGGHHQDQ